MTAHSTTWHYEGRLAFESGLSLEDNPYDQKDDGGFIPEAQEWAEGWKQAASEH